MIELLKFILLGFVQGVTEVLPISSSGHISILSSIFGIEDNGVAFEIFLHLASIIAVIFFLRKRLWQLIKGFFLYIFSKERINYKYEFNYCLMVVVATIPAAIVAILFGDLINKASSTLWIVGMLLMINGIMLYVFSLIKATRTDQLNYKDALVIGLFQCGGIFPGISRSGSCLNGAMVRKMEKEKVADFVFILLIPAVLGSLILKFKDFASFSLDGNGLLYYSISFAVTLVVTYFSLKLLLIVIRKSKFIYFSIYCEIIGLITLVYGLVK